MTSPVAALRDLRDRYDAERSAAHAAEGQSARWRSALKLRDLLVLATREAADHEAAWPLEPQTPAFRWLDATLYRDRPAPALPGTQRLRIMYGSDLWPAGEDDHSEPHEATIRELAARHADHKRTCIDIEHWGIDRADPSAGLAKFERLLRWWREENKTTRVGIYNVAPILSPDEARDGPDGWRMAEVRRRNDALAPLIAEVDDLYPVLYQIVAPQERGLWGRYVRLKLEMARGLAGGRPVLPLVWPQYHAGLLPDLAGQDVDAGLWAATLDAAQDLADGAVLWSEPGKAWDPDAAWWADVQRRIQGIT